MTLASRNHLGAVAVGANQSPLLLIHVLTDTAEKLKYIVIFLYYQSHSQTRVIYMKTIFSISAETLIILYGLYSILLVTSILGLI